MAISKAGIKASHSQYLKSWTYKQMGWCCKRSHTKRAEELDIPVREVIDKMLGWSDTEENELRLL